MEGHTHTHSHTHQQHQYHPQQQQMSATTTTETSGDRFPQWSIQETKEFLVIRAELDRTFMETKRNKLLWEVISTKMREKGFHRSAEQCKCKWKNLVTRYKGCETMEPEAMRQQFPFYNEMQTIFTARMQRMLWAEAESGPGPSKKSKPHTHTLSSDDEDEEDSDGDNKTTKKRAKKAKISTVSSSGTTNVVSSSINAMKEMLEDFMKKQLEMEVQWREAYEVREDERRQAEAEWRQKMEALENERLLMERLWREREEQRRFREDARAEKRDALINALLIKLQREDSNL